MTEIANYGYKGEVSKSYPKDKYHPRYPEVKADVVKVEPAVPKADVSGYDCTGNQG